MKPKREAISVVERTRAERIRADEIQFERDFGHGIHITLDHVLTDPLVRQARFRARKDVIVRQLLDLSRDLMAERDPLFVAVLDDLERDLAGAVKRAEGEYGPRTIPPAGDRLRRGERRRARRGSSAA